MSSLHVLGQDANPTNPLLVLAAAVDKTNQLLRMMQSDLARMAINSDPRATHTYGLALRSEDTWGSYCISCSELEQDYIYPCALHPDGPTPPSHVRALNAPPP